MILEWKIKFTMKMKNRINDLKSGYTTGAHAVSALKAALISFFTNKYEIYTVDVTLPDGEEARLKIDNIEINNDYISTVVTKSYNDDIDVTKGCEITCKIIKNSDILAALINKISHNPHELSVNGLLLKIWAGKGLGVVTKIGLQTTIGYPAINPVPLEMMKKAFEEVVLKYKIPQNQIIDVVFEVKDGEKLAKETANEKAGIIGGISFIGKTGYVKPISNEAYIDSLKEEINVAAYNHSKTIVMTMGNSCLNFAHQHYNLDKECFIEIGNFIFDCLGLTKGLKFEKIAIVANIGKLTKIAQGKKNTNNRYGGIDFSLIQSWLKEENFPENLLHPVNSFTTVSSLENLIINDFPDYQNDFYALIVIKSIYTLSLWLNELNINNCKLEVILTDGDKIKNIQIKDNK